MLQQQEQLPQLVDQIFKVVIKAHTLQDHVVADNEQPTEDSKALVADLGRAERKAYGASKAASNVLFDKEELQRSIQLLMETKIIIELIHFNEQ